MNTKALSGVAILSAAVLLGGAAIGAQAPGQPGTSARQLEVTFKDGLATVKAQGVTVRDILAEWARKCDCQVIGAEKITNSQVPAVQYVNQPEAVIMKSLLNPGTGPGAVSGGYVFVPRNPGETGASAYQSIRIAPVSHPTATMSYQQSSSPVAAPLVTDTSDEVQPVTSIPIADPSKAAQPAAPAAAQPAGPLPPPSVMPTTGVNSTGGRTGGPGQPTVPPTVPPPGTTGRGGGGGL